MPAHGSSLGSKAFGEHADAGLIVAYQSHQDALRFLSSALGQANGIALLQGPTGAGKSTVIKEQADWSSRDAAVALVEGTHLTPRRLITDMLSQFGVRTVSQHDEQLLQAVNNFVTQQTRTARAPVLIVDNADRATSSALRLLNWLAALDARGNYALRIVLTGKERLSALLRHASMRSLARRHPAAYSLNPLTARETMIYLRTRLIAAGGERAEKVFPVDVCDRLRELSSGWPGPLNERAIEAMERTTELQSARPIPRVIVTRDGETVTEYELKEQKYVIGRTELADIVIEDSYVSKMHAMLQVYANAIVLIDLNSTNGTTVNSRLVPKTILRNNDIIALGRHRLKIENVPALSAEMDEKIRASDTMTMRHLEDLRRSRAIHTIATLKHQ
ncbi:MAG: FHA domain-containing protein [Gammaproteobacteria bacterium]|nr:FHA domain-containing protein [Gammaproteobacteria bacterium]MDH3751434.1 FHA domain-containing protein [Gammaproteobacteria bacterium]MDH3804809.1 FHA domain-containing protein [Gammaproteobacteria bacterium]